MLQTMLFCEESRHECFRPCYFAKKAALCAILLCLIRTETLSTAELQKKIDDAALIQVPILTTDQDKLSRLISHLEFSNSEYDVNCR